MTDNRFIKKFKSKSDVELEKIALDSTSYVFDARYAAVTLLKERNFDSTIISQVEKEYENLIRAERKNTEDIKVQEERLIKRILQIPIKGTGKYGLENGNELQIKRFNGSTFQVRIEDNYKSGLAPVMICKIKDDSTYLTFPFLYLKAILIYGIGGTALILILSVIGYVENDIFTFIIPFILTIGIQLILMPFIYFVILNFFRKRLSKK